MCGIVALLAVDGAPLDPVDLKAAADALAHRGPDDEGFVLAGAEVAPVRLGGPGTQVPGVARIDAARRTPGYTVGLANRRLAIIDLSPAGHGPMSSGDEEVWLTYNGEVYNYRELAGELSARGHTFRSRTDTEVVLAAYLEWGIDFVAHLNGMFALAIWDGRSRKLVIARDRVGIKPLYVGARNDLHAVASEPKALLAIGMERAIDWETAYGYLVAGYADWSERTFFRGIRQVAPGTVEEFHADGTHMVHRYWHPPAPGRYAGSRDEAVATFRDLLFDSVRLQLRSDVPVGTALSGGLDSSSVVAAVAALGERSPARHAFSAVFPGTPLDESRYAEAVVRRFGVDWHCVEPTAAELLDDLDSLLHAQDEPFPSTSSYAQWRVMRLAREHGVTVLLDGQGGDELLAGYDGFRPYAIADAIRRGDVAQAAADLRAARGPRARGVLLTRAGAALAPRVVSDLGRRRSRRRAARFLAAELHEEHGARLLEAERTEPTLDGVLRRSLSFTLPVLLRSEDRNSMAHSREARVPFLDHRLIEFAATLPSQLKLAGGETKVVLRRALGDLLPAEVLSRRDKLGFVTPEAEWLRRLGEPLVRETLRHAGDGIAADAALSLWTRLQQGDGSVAAQVWRVVCFERWRRVLAVT